MTSATTPRLDPRIRINDLMRAHPSTLLVLAAYGLDTCCSGALPLVDAAAKGGVSLEHLTADLERALREDAAG